MNLHLCLLSLFWLIPPRELSLIETQVFCFRKIFFSLHIYNTYLVVDSRYIPNYKFNNQSLESISKSKVESIQYTSELTRY